MPLLQEIFRFYLDTMCIDNRFWRLSLHLLLLLTWDIFRALKRYCRASVYWSTFIFIFHKCSFIQFPALTNRNGSIQSKPKIFYQIRANLKRNNLSSLSLANNMTTNLVKGSPKGQARKRGPIADFRRELDHSTCWSWDSCIFWKLLIAFSFQKVVISLNNYCQIHSNANYTSVGIVSGLLVFTILHRFRERPTAFHLEVYSIQPVESGLRLLG